MHGMRRARRRAALGPASVLALALTLALALALSGCAKSYYEAYQEANPGWVPAFPDSEANLEQTVASLYAPPKRRNQVTVRRLDLLRVDVEPWQEISFDALRSGEFESSEAHDYLVVADLVCRAEYDLNVYRGEKIAWYLLRENRLRSFDHYEFYEACGAWGDFWRAGAGDEATVRLEKAAAAHVAQEFPTSMHHVVHLVGRGVALARVGRLDEAQALLSEGRGAMDAGRDRHPEFEEPGVRLEVGDPDEARAALARLEEAIRAERRSARAQGR